MALVFLLLCSSVLAAPPMCEDFVKLHENCTMLTSSVYCPTLNYDIINMSGVEVVDNASLTVFNEEIYSFWFNYTNVTGDYIVRLCDGSTREVIVEVESDGDVIAGLMAIAPLLAGLLMILAGWSLSEKHNALKIFLFLLANFMFITSLHFISLGLGYFNPDWVDAQDTVSTVVFWYFWVWFLLICYWVLFGLWTVFNGLADKKRKDKEMKY